MPDPAPSSCSSASLAKPSPFAAFYLPVAPFIITISWYLISAVVAFSFFSASLPEWLLYIPFLLSFVIIGLPHGAVDHWVLTELKQYSFTLTNIIRVILPYITLSVFYGLLWSVTPEISFILFILITWFHWGQGDLYSLVMYTGRQHLTSRLHLILAVFIRGGLPMLVPLLFFPEVYRNVTDNIVGLLVTPNASQLDLLFSNDFRLILGSAFFVTVCFYFITTARRARSWFYDLIEVTLLALLFSLSHPVFAIGIYFCFWHGWRHIVRITHMQRKEIDVPKHKSLIQFTIHAVPTTALALLALAGMYFLVPNRPDTIQEFTSLYLILISVLTLPHVWVVTKMDKHEQIWNLDISNQKKILDEH